MTKLSDTNDVRGLRELITMWVRKSYKNIKDKFGKVIN